MNHIDEESLALLAIGDDAPSGAAAEHLAACPACRDELADLRRVVTVAKSSQSIDLEQPSARVWDRIATDLGFDDRSTAPAAAAPAPAPAPAPGAHLARRRPRVRRRTAVFLTAAAAVVGLVLGLGGGWYLFAGGPGGGDTVVSRTALDPLPGWSGARGSAELERDGDGRLSLVVDLDHRAADGAAPLREVWMMRSDLSGLVSVGFLDGDTGRFVVPSGVDPTRYPVVDVSAESNDGDPAHSGDSVVRGTLRSRA
ncbi:anti-sigma factor [Curtobacterium sp. VKM Ac-2865]|uniref:anti-sigma factor domain-containing protein n=1 Tax=Curtobacterium sp. VKM Ac-2865 TaxID=2783817 RepID=UPI00188CD912|nr:anti-sigma factor [Curtobacterium sp. VKM Ac-2865]MBF4581595.1 anti-sigma factor [Curtobacterium sp. VKM Ac-2865]